MAEEVEISNVGLPDGVASEATLRSLLKAVEKMSRESGKDPKSEQSKIIKTHSNAIKANTLESTKYRDALEDKTEATEEATRATRSLTRTMQGALVGAIGQVVGSLKGVSGELLSGSDRISDFTQHIPLLGGMASMITSIIDETFDSYRTLAMSGAALGNDLNELRIAAAETYMSLDQFVAFTKENTDVFSTYGGTVTQGIAHFRALNAEFDVHREQLMNMGFTYEDLNDTLAHYMFLSRAGARAQERDTAAQAEAAAEYAKNLSTLAKLTGEDVKSMQDRIAQEQANIAWQGQLAQMEEEEAARIRQTYATIMATQGSAAAEYFKQQILGMPPLTEQTQIFAAVMSEAAENVREMAHVTRDGINSNEEFWEAQDRLLVESIANMGSTYEDFESIISAGAAGVGGAASTLYEVLNSTGLNLASYFERDGTFREEKLLQDIRAARAETEASDATVESMSAFDRAMKQIYQSLRIGFVESGILSAFADGIQGVATFLESEEFQMRLQRMIDNISDKFSNFITTLGAEEGGLWAAIKELFTDDLDLTQAAADLTGMIGSGIYDALVNSSFGKIVAGSIAAVIGGTLVSAAIAGKISSIASGSIGRSTTGGIAGRVAGSTGTGIGRGAEGLISGVGRGFASVGMAAPKVAAGGAALGAAIAAVGAGFAGAMFLMERTIGPFAESMRSFEDIDGEKLSQAGSGMLRLAGGIAALGASDVTRSFSGIISGALDGLADFLFGVEDPMDALKRFSEHEALDLSRIKHNASALVAFNELMSEATSANPGVMKSLQSSISAFFTGDDPLSKLVLFTSEKIDADLVRNNAQALVDFNVLMSDATAASSGIISSVADSISSLFTDSDPLQQLILFTEKEIDTELVKNNARALVEFNKAMSDASQISNQSSIVRGIMDGISGIFRSSSDIDNLVQFGNLDINAPRVIENADALRYFVNTLSGLSTSELAELNISRSAIISFERMAGMGLGLNTTAAALERLSAVEGIDRNISSINAALDPSGLRNYTSAIEDLVSALEDLNNELREENTSWFSRGSSGTSAGEVIQQVNNSNRSSTDNSRLISLLENMISLLSADAETQQKIERNTRKLRSSGNLVSGVSN